MRIKIPVLPWQARVGLTILAAFIIFHLTVLSTPTEQMPANNGFILLDKWLHVLAFGLLGLTVSYVLVSHDASIKQKMSIVFIVVFLYGVAIEVAQGTIPHRYFGLGDIIANGVGAIFSLSWFILERNGMTIPVTGLRFR